MAGKRKRSNGTWEYVFKRAGVLPAPVYMTFHSEAEGDAFAARAEKMLDLKVVPLEFRQDQGVSNIEQLVREYVRDAHPSDKDQSALSVIVKSRGKTALTAINAAWVDDWIAEMKRVDRVAPTTIVWKVGALARCTDWGMRKGMLQMPDHPLRSLPKGYAQYTKTDAALAGGARVDGERDRRLERGEDEANRAVIAGGVLARKQRPLRLPDPRALLALYVLALETAMRLRELYTLEVHQVDLKRATVFLEKTKNGDKRQVPLSSVALAELRDYLPLRAIPADHPQDLVFPWWNGDSSKRELHLTTDFLSKLFVGIFDQAGSKGLLFHDLRHEATSRLFERTTLSESRIMKITGHKSQRMLMRYANLRGSDLAAELW